MQKLILFVAATLALALAQEPQSDACKNVSICLNAVLFFSNIYYDQGAAKPTGSILASQAAALGPIPSILKNFRGNKLSLLDLIFNSTVVQESEE